MSPETIALSVAMAVAAGLVGCFAVMRRMALSADALSHVALPGIGVAMALHIHPLAGAVAMLFFGALLVWALENRARLATETIIGVVFSAALAVAITLPMPPLRGRPSDIPPLATHFLKKYASENGKPLEGFSEEAMLRLSGYGWPGNVRELENVVERAAVLASGSYITAAELPPHLVPRREGGLMIPGSTLDAIERYAILKTLESTGGSTSKAAEILGMSVRKIQYKLHEYQSVPKGVGAPAIEPPQLESHR